MGHYFLDTQYKQLQKRLYCQSVGLDLENRQDSCPLFWFSLNSICLPIHYYLQPVPIKSENLV